MLFVSPIRGHILSLGLLQTIKRHFSYAYKNLMIRGVGRVPLKMCIRISVKGKLGHSSVNKKRASLTRAFLRSFYQHDHILGLKSWSLSHKWRLDERDMMMLLYFQKFFSRQTACRLGKTIRPDVLRVQRRLISSRPKFLRPAVRVVKLERSFLRYTHVYYNIGAAERVVAACSL